MRTLPRLLMALCVPMLVTLPMSATSQVSFGFSIAGPSIGIHVSTFPQLVAIPGYPVYYAPQLPANYFFYDGMYWVFVNDSWCASTWYDGPWQLVAPEVVPVYILRVPVRYYRRPPPYFGPWVASAPPHWGEHWGPSWVERRHGWDQWNRASAPPPAPLPAYQRHYAGGRYPSVQQQQVLQQQNYAYRPRDELTRERYQRQAAAPQPEPQAAPAQAQRRQAGQAEQRQAEQAQRSQQQAQQRQAEQAQRSQQQAQQRQAEQAQRSQQQAQQRQAEQAQRSQQQAQQRRVEQAQHSQQQAQQRQTEQAQRSQQQAQHRQAEQALHSPQQAQQRQAEQSQHARQQQPQQQRHAEQQDQRAQNRGQDRKEPGG